MREFTTTHEGFEAELTVGERVALAQLAGELLMLLESSPQAGSEPIPDNAAHPDLSDDDALSNDVQTSADKVEPHDERLPRFSQGHVAEPDDPILRRLLPDAAPTEPDVGAEFRRLTQQDLISGKISRLRTLIAALVADGIALEFDPDDQHTQHRSYELLIPRDRAHGFASALTDVRLALSERMGIQTDADSEQLYDDVVSGWDGSQVLDDDAQHMGTLFLFSGFLQESLLNQMLADLRGRGRPGK